MVFIIIVVILVASSWKLFGDAVLTMMLLQSIMMMMMIVVFTNLFECLSKHVLGLFVFVILIVIVTNHQSNASLFLLLHCGFPGRHAGGGSRVCSSRSGA